MNRAEESGVIWCAVASPQGVKRRTTSPGIVRSSIVLIFMSVSKGRVVTGRYTKHTRAAQ